MRIVFFGNADFGCNTLEGLAASEHEIVAVVTNKNKKSGRNLKLRSTPIKEITLKLGLNLIEVDSLEALSLKDLLKSLCPDIFVVIAYKIMPKQIYSIPALGSVNLHASLLPSYKGAAPIQRAIINDEKYTGLSSFFLNNSIDGGELIKQMKINIDKGDTFENVWRNLYHKSSQFMIDTLTLINNNQKSLISDLNLRESYAPKIKKEELKINWLEPSALIHNKVRAFHPFPSMYTCLNNKRVKILKSQKTNYRHEHSLEIGTAVVDNNKLLVKCGEGFLDLITVRPDSKQDMNAIDFVNGFFNSTETNINVFR